MKQADPGLNLTTKRSTRNREFLDEMNRVVPWAALVELMAQFGPGPRGRKRLRCPRRPRHPPSASRTARTTDRFA